MKENNDRYTMWKKVVSEVRGRHDRGDIFSTYLEQLNKCKFSSEFDDTLDAIIISEKERRKRGY
jgi:hypothetical protein